MTTRPSPATRLGIAIGLWYEAHPASAPGNTVYARIHDLAVHADVGFPLLFFERQWHGEVLSAMPRKLGLNVTDEELLRGMVGIRLLEVPR